MSVRTAGLVAAVVVAAIAPSVASAGPPGIPSAPAFSAVSGGAAGATGCSNLAVTSRFHENLAGQAILPLEPLPADAVSVPTWTGSFTTAGLTYPFTMVGTDPTAGSRSTHVPVEIIPLRLDFPGNGCVLGHNGMAADLEASPLFSPAFLPAGATQWLDNYERSNFWSTVSTASPGYHLLLDASDVPDVTLRVPASQGLAVFDPTINRPEAIVSGLWFLNQLRGLLNSLHVSPTTLAVFVPYNTFVTDGNPSDCLTPPNFCAYYIGFHDAVLNDKNPHAINTLAMASYVDFGNVTPFDWGTEVLSHELVEWASDPFDHGGRINGAGAFWANLAPAWSSPYFANGSVCTTVLEVADPLEGGNSPRLFTNAIGSSTNYIFANAAFLPWFARESPSSAIGGLYDLGGVFGSYSDAC